MQGKNFINNEWILGSGNELLSEDPATGKVIWQGKSASEEQVHQAILTAENAFYSWSTLAFEERVVVLQKFCEVVNNHKQELIEVISKEVGKPLWESDTEVSVMLNKLSVSIEAYHERCKESVKEMATGTLVLRHRPHGTVGILGPFNFPLHLPMGHIIPALLAGNTVVFKPSEFTPLVGEKLMEYWQEIKPPAGIMNLIQGPGPTGSQLVKHPLLKGVFFTGSYKTGQKIARDFREQPEKILALEMGGNNPLVVHKVNNIYAAVYQTIQSAYITSGQRCTCARRLIVTKGSEGEKFVQALSKAIHMLKVGPYTSKPEPFMGPQISNLAAEKVIAAYENLKKFGAHPLVPLKRIDPHLPFLSPALLDVTEVVERSDEEIFGPVLQLVWVEDFEAALYEANQTTYGLAAGLFCEDKNLYCEFLKRVKAGVMNWNKALTGASSQAPFGGIGRSGNHRPSAYYAADYCAYPVASLEADVLTLPDILPPGMTL